MTRSATCAGLRAWPDSASGCGRGAGRVLVLCPGPPGLALARLAYFALARASRRPRPRAGGSAKLTAVTRGRNNKVSSAAEAAYLADVALAANFDSLLATAREAEQAYRQAQATRAPAE